jgi:hypothetical protein
MKTMSTWTAETIAEPVRRAMTASDVDQFAQLLSPDVHWGPRGAQKPPCRNRDQVLAWYSKGPAADATAQVIELTVAGDQLLVGLLVDFDGRRDGSGAGTVAERWQILTIGPDGVRDIRGYEARNDAAADLLESTPSSRDEPKV